MKEHNYYSHFIDKNIESEKVRTSPYYTGSKGQTQESNPDLLDSQLTAMLYFEERSPLWKEIQDSLPDSMVGTHLRLPSLTPTPLYLGTSPLFPLG